MEPEWLGVMGLGFVMLGLLFVLWIMIKWNNEDPNK
ncbi:uncharacterized protein METZ01_LOCUS306779 [marine metagenome]|uniref:Uncharacterized protein n=1 Tax=marine metagenome TaxID=408172 RepID=A0A382N0N0_9ZZZZ